MQAFAGPKIAPDAVANAPKFTMLGTKIQKLVATLATRTLQVLYILLLCIVRLNKVDERFVAKSCQRLPSWIFQK